MKKINEVAARQARKTKLEMELAEIKEVIEQEIIKHHYPLIKKEFEGKYFKYNNGYNAEDRWSLYTKIVEIKPDDVYDTHGNGVTSRFTGWSFEVTSDNRIHIEKSRNYVHSIGKQITEKEFITAWNRMVKKIDALE